MNSAQNRYVKNSQKANIVKSKQDFSLASN